MGAAGFDDRGGQREAPDLCGVDGMKPFVETPLARNLLAPTAEDNPSLKALNKISDVVLSYRPKSKQPKPRKRKKVKREKTGK